MRFPFAAAASAAALSAALFGGLGTASDLGPDALVHVRLSNNADAQLALQVSVESSDRPCGYADVTINNFRLDRGHDNWGSGEIPARLDNPSANHEDDGKKNQATASGSHSSVTSFAATWDFECYQPNHNHDDPDDNDHESAQLQSEVLTVTITKATFKRSSTSPTSLGNVTTSASIQNAVFKLLIDPTRRSKIMQVLGSDVVVSVPAQDQSGAMAVDSFSTPHNPVLQQAMVELEIVRHQRAELNRLIAQYEEYIGALTTDVMCEAHGEEEGEAAPEAMASANSTAPSLSVCDNVHCVMKALVSQISGTAKKLLHRFANPAQGAGRKSTCHFPFTKDHDGSPVEAPAKPAWPPAFCHMASSPAAAPFGASSASRPDSSIINTGHGGSSGAANSPATIPRPSFSPSVPQPSPVSSSGGSGNSSSSSSNFWARTSTSTVNILLVSLGFGVLILGVRKVVKCVRRRGGEKESDYHEMGFQDRFWARRERRARRKEARQRRIAAVKSFVRSAFCLGSSTDCEDDEEKLVTIPAESRTPLTLPMHHRQRSRAYSMSSTVSSRPPSYRSSDGCAISAAPLSAEEPPLVVRFSRPRAASQSSRTSHTSQNSVSAMSTTSSSSASSASTTMEQSLAQFRAMAAAVGDMIAVDQSILQRIVGSRALRTRAGYGVGAAATQRPVSPDSVRSVPPQYEYIGEVLPDYQSEEEEEEEEGWTQAPLMTAEVSVGDEGAK